MLVNSQLLKLSKSSFQMNLETLLHCLIIYIRLNSLKLYIRFISTSDYETLVKIRKDILSKV